MAKVLVIDDEEEIRSILREALEDEGHEVEEAPDGEAGIDLFKWRPADIVITDMIMPKKKGLEVVEELRMTFPNVKIIAITGVDRIASELYLNTAKKLGVDQTFTKPFNVQKIVKAVRNLAG